MTGETVTEEDAFEAISKTQRELFEYEYPGGFIDNQPEENVIPEMAENELTAKHVISCPLTNVFEDDPPSEEEFDGKEFIDNKPESAVVNVEETDVVSSPEYEVWEDGTDFVEPEEDVILDIEMTDHQERFMEAVRDFTDALDGITVDRGNVIIAQCHYVIKAVQGACNE